VLARKPEITELALADADEEGLRRAAGQVGEKASTTLVDVADERSVAQLLRSNPKPRVLLNCVGPGLRFAVPLGGAAIDAGIDYVDLQDDAEAVAGVEALAEPAVEAGITMVSGAGLTPGLSDLLARRAYDAFDTTEEIRIYWVANMTERPTVANWGHRLGIWTSNVPIVEKGQLAYVPGGSDDVVVEWPEPAGEVVERLCGHPEPLTLHKRLPGVQRITVRGGYTPNEHDELIGDLRALGLTSLDPVSVGGTTMSAVEFMSDYARTEAFRSTHRFQSILERERKIGDNNGLRVEVIGTRDGKRERFVGVFFSRDRNIGIYMTAAVTTYMVALGEIEGPGLYFLEDLDHQKILDRLAEEGVTITETMEAA
jgi:saccharopine dehydrogenase-like NADP-dependent oxidoreductase